ncbi:Thimet oligopeptidase [Dissophora globulifera]|nr:Thimet oligopeptidase [Dissophora globulifera]
MTASPIQLPATAKELADISARVQDLLRATAGEVIAVSAPQRTLENTLLRLQEGQSRAAAMQTQCTFPAMAKVRDAATEAKKALQKAWSALYSNREVYTVLSEMDTLLKEKSDGSKAVIDAETQRLLDHTLRLFRRHGASLASHDQEKLTAMRTKISGLELDFQKNLNEDTTSILLTAAELEGCTASWISGLAKVHESGKDFYRVTMKTPDVLNVGRNAALPETRKRVAVTYRQVCTATNGPILDELIQLRHEAAVMQGYANHAAYQLDINMAKTVETVDTFLDTITDAISLKRESDKQVLLDLKREDYQKRGWDAQFDGELYSWDIRYYMEILLKERYAVDNSLIQEYFELEHVRDQILGVYSKIFQLRFEQIPGKYWADDVTLFAVYDQKAQDDAGEAGKKSSDAFKIGYFYLDLFPRPGKYAHQCVVPLRPSYVDSKTGERILPVAVNVGNLSRPTADRPAMLKHSETGEELPDDLIASLVRTRKVLKGLLFSQQVAVTAIDMKLHSIDPRQRPQSIAQLWKDMSEQIIGVKAESDPSTNPACQLYHIAMGYDAGYYVYAWSEMHAHDLFTRFRGSAGHTGTRAMDETLGREYWEKVLVPNATVEPIELLRAFLGREPNAQAFQRYLTEE